MFYLFLDAESLCGRRNEVANMILRASHNDLLMWNVVF